MSKRSLSTTAVARPELQGVFDESLPASKTDATALLAELQEEGALAPVPARARPPLPRARARRRPRARTTAPRTPDGRARAPTRRRRRSAHARRRPPAAAVAKKCREMQEKSDWLAQKLKNHFEGELRQIPPKIREMTMEQFIKNFAGDVKDAEHRTKRGRLQMPPPPPALGRAAPGKATRGGPALGRAASEPSTPGSARAQRSKRGGSESMPPSTPSVRRRPPPAPPPRTVQTRTHPPPRAPASHYQQSEFDLSQCDSARRPTRGRAAGTPGARGLMTPAASSGAAVAFTPRVHETPRMAGQNERGYSENGSPISMQSECKATVTRRGRPKLAMELDDGVRPPPRNSAAAAILPRNSSHAPIHPPLQSELDLTDDATLAELDEQARKDAEMKLELLNMQVQQALAAVKGGKK